MKTIDRNVAWMSAPSKKLQVEKTIDTVVAVVPITASRGAVKKNIDRHIVE